MSGLVKWLQDALRVVFEKSGMVGVSVAVLLVLLVLIVVWLLFGPNVLGVFASPHGYGG